MDAGHDPVLAVELSMRLWTFKALAVSCATGLYAALTDDEVSAADLAATLDLPTDAVETLLEIGAELTLVNRGATGYRAGRATHAHLLPSAPFPIKGWVTSLDRRLFPAWRELDRALRHDAPTSWDPSEMDSPFLDDEVPISFWELAHGVSTLTATILADAVQLDNCRRLLDVGGGSGATAIVLCRSYPQLSVTVLDLPAACAVARKNIAQAGLSDRIDVIEGDFFVQPLPTGYDVVLLAMVLHDWSEQDCRKILRACRAALRPTGAIVISELLVDDGKDGPLDAAIMSLHMLVDMAGRNYTAAEYTRWLTELGWIDPQVVRFHGPTANGVVLAVLPGNDAGAPTALPDKDGISLAASADNDGTVLAVADDGDATTSRAADFSRGYPHRARSAAWSAPLAEALVGFAVSRLLAVAVQTGLFDLAVRLDRIDAATVTRDLGLAARPAEMLLTAVAASGLLIRHDDVYRPAPVVREHLVAGARYDLSSWLVAVGADDYPAWAQLLDVLHREQDGALRQLRSARSWQARVGADALTVRMLADAHLLGLPTAAHILQWGGIGAGAVELCQLNPTRHATVVTPIALHPAALQTITAAGLADRVKVVEPGQGVLGGYQLALVAGAGDESRTALAAVLPLLAPNGKLVAYDLLLDEARRGPRAALLADLDAHRHGRRQPSIADLRRDAIACGLVDVQTRPVRTPMATAVCLARRPAAGGMSRLAGGTRKRAL